MLNIFGKLHMEEDDIGVTDLNNNFSDFKMIISIHSRKILHRCRHLQCARYTYM